eukprot:CAMPEP_0176166478 /NCGR_PEP_ID=MMETSP0120_2-20121206/85147_1 /TAXON_ID=160619 /ORGANISM="Kryptoperidinium foliaceum, Strain CCMP 1326" /LENGTH=45 /DNA_ID= /DNA_START= /DNA_END= /DNA_ORIENTATION=
MTHKLGSEQFPDSQAPHNMIKASTFQAKEWEHEMQWDCFGSYNLW